MLVLSRKAGERVLIAENIIVEVIAVKGGRVRLGVQAPPEIGVWRGELADEQASLAAASATCRKPR
jgi:carbon storage regulator